MSHVIGLRCKECGKAHAKELLAACAECWGGARARLRPRPRAGDLHARRRSPRGRATSGATASCCRSTASRRVGHGTGFTPLLRAPRLGARLGIARPLDQVRRRLHPHAVLQGPPGRGLADARRRSSASTRSAARRPATWRTRWPRAPPRPACEAVVLVPDGPRARRSSPAPPSTARRSSASRQLRPRQPPVRADRRPLRLGHRQRQPARVLRRGIEDGRASRWRSSCGWTLPRPRRRARWRAAA